MSGHHEPAAPIDYRASTAAGTSILWPISVFGGCIVVAAIGVVGLYLSGSSTDSELVAGGGSPADRAVLEPDRAARFTFGSTVPDAAGQSSAATGDTGDSGDGADETAPGSNPDPDGADDTDEPSVGDTSDPAPQAEEPSSTTSGPASQEPPVGPGVYRVSDRKGEQLASLVVADEHLITSASAVAGLQTVALEVNGRWFTATVGPYDLLTDVALLSTEEPLDALGIPSIDIGEEPIGSGTDTIVGYYDLAVGDPSGDGAASGIDEGPTERDDPPGKDASRSDEDDERAPGWRYGQDQRRRDRNDDQPVTLPPAAERWAGRVYSMAQPLETLADRWIYDPIRTGIPQADGVAGSPLRDTRGRLIGLVLGSNAPSVAALPIDRALDVVDSLVKWGVGSRAWLGADVIESGGRVRVDAVDPDGPATELEVGDLVLAIDGDVLRGVDHLDHLVRQAGLGTTVELILVRGNDALSVEVPIGAAPQEPPSDP